MLRSIRFFLLFTILCVLALPVYAQDEDDTTPPPPEDPPEPVEVQITWNEDILVIQNTADGPVDLSLLRLEGLLGEINNTDWIMKTNPERGTTYDLRVIPPGGCMIAYQGANVPELPEDVICEPILGEFQINTTDDIIWQIDSGEFTPYIEQIELPACDTTETSCAILVPTSPSRPHDAPIDEPETIDVRAIWTPDVFVLLNVSGRGADLSELTLEATRGGIMPEDWVMDFSQESGGFYVLDNVRPGSCLVSYVGTSRPELPSSISCTRIIGRAVLEDFDNAVWEVTQDGFTPVIAEEELEHCTNERTSCTIAVPNADLERDPTNESGDEGETVEIQLTWSPDVLIIKNEHNHEVDLSNISFQGQLGRISPDDWEIGISPMGQPYALNSVEPGDCLVAYFGFERPEFPPGFTCDAVVAEYAIPTPNNIIWGVAQGGFTVYLGEAEGERCDANETSCEIMVPEAAE